MRVWKEESLLTLHKSLPQRVVDITSIYGGSDDIDKLLKLGVVEVNTGRYEKDDVLTPTRKLTLRKIRESFRGMN